ncbi:hypothetical protein F5X99DRAFT_384222 [Biscogniauxia marginata]|nr:hypothetical protein F5X99DRAFT_384222 [Biscogniauxia marginata]
MPEFVLLVIIMHVEVLLQVEVHLVILISLDIVVCVIVIGVNILLIIIIVDSIKDFDIGIIFGIIITDNMSWLMTKGLIVEDAIRSIFTNDIHLTIGNAQLMEATTIQGIG